VTNLDIKASKFADAFEIKEAARETREYRKKCEEDLHRLKQEQAVDGFSALPQNFRLANIGDFVMDGKRKIGMQFLIKWESRDSFYQLCIVSMNLTAGFLQPFIDENRVFVEK
jgi:hypothetical protein